ncbi:L-lactate permease [Brenneria uluponensis]|uniref:L-lactate permease n=1 Tax=Brenneria uluponensis TaxID=3057057 RepID=UPI0028EED206|nr:L-lactate permease [Brenneria ulupoensis]
MSILAIFPLLTCALTILLAKRSAVFGALTGMLTAVVIILPSPDFRMDFDGLWLALTKALILTLSAAIVILPGLYFNALLSGRGIITNIQTWVEKLPYRTEHKVLLLLFGLLPAVESLTGFGVSLFLSIPILFHLFNRRVAFRLAMLGMNIMPWGTLALATVVGATLSGLTVGTLGYYTSLTSFLVFPLLALVAMRVVGGSGLVRNTLPAALSLSLCLSAVLVVFNWLHLTEVAGIIAGAVVCMIGAFVLPKTSISDVPINHASALKAFIPYGLVLTVIILERSIPGAYDLLANSLVLKAGNVSFHVLTSPGVVLLIVALWVYWQKPIALPHSPLLKRARISCVSLFAFVLLGQIMLQSGMIATFAKSLSTWNGSVLTVISPLMGMVSGFITGSNLSGNALTMLVQADIGNHIGKLALFAAAQNSGAGHTVFTSIPIIVLILTLARDESESVDGETEVKEYELLRFGVGTALLVLPALVLMTIVSGYIL